MSSVLNIYSSLSSITWRPIDFNLEGDHFSLKKDYVLFDNGMRFNIHEGLKNCVDFSFNNRTGMFLTNLVYNNKLFYNKKTPSLVEDLKTIESPIGIKYGGGLKILNYKNINNNLKEAKVLYNTNLEYYDSSYIFKFNFIGGNRVKVISHEGKALTHNGFVFNDYSLTFNNEVFPTDESQVFEYILFENKIALFIPNLDYSIVIKLKSGSDNFILQPLILGLNSNFPDDILINFISYKKTELNFNNSVSDSFLVKYDTNLVQSEDVLYLNTNFSDSNLYTQNYLGLFPVENPTFNFDGSASYLLYIHGLKNYQTPEYEYATGSPLIPSSPAIRRVYNKIFSGTNQRSGYQKLFLGYQADTKITVFPQGTETPFYFPSVSIRTPLSASGLIEDGASAGELPFTSDRISMYRMNYEEINPGQPDAKSINRYDRTWLCSWLSGTNTGEKVWMDRYYNAAYYTLDQALTAKAHVYNEKIFPEKQFTFDIPSEMYMEPGILYKYDRVGKETSIEFVNYLNSDKNLSKGSNTLTLNSWVSSPIIVDESNYHNNAIVFYNMDPLNFKGDYWSLDGTTHAIIPPSKELLNKGNLTVSLWLSVDNWGNIEGDQIFGNYYDSGFGLLNTGIKNISMFTLINTTSSSVNNFNFKFGNLGGGNLTYTSSSPKYEVVHRLPNYNYWVFDLRNKQAVLLNAFNNIMKGFSFHDKISFAHQVELDSNYNIHIYDNTFKMAVKLTENGSLLDYTAFPSSANKIDIDLNDEIVAVTGEVSVIDNLNNLWEVIGGNLYKNKERMALVGYTQALVVDSKNNLWISHDQDRISKLNTETMYFEFSERVGKGSNKSLDPCAKNEMFRFMDFVRVPVKGVCDKKIKYQDNLIIVDTRTHEVLRIGENGEYINRLDLQGLTPNIPYLIEYNAKGGFTGYQFSRKFLSSGRYSKTALSWKLKIGHPNKNINTVKLLTLTHETSTLPRGWHNFALVFDAYNGSAKYYIDSILVDAEYFTPKAFEIIYEYRSSILIGAASIKNTTINDIVGLDDFDKLNGNIGDIRMYANALTTGEIEQLYFSSKFAIPRPDLIWNRRVGIRSFIEEIEHWFKEQLPGSKSKYFNINIHNLNIDEESKLILESAIRANIEKIIPANNTLYKINWI